MTLTDKEYRETMRAFVRCCKAATSIPEQLEIFVNMIDFMLLHTEYLTENLKDVTLLQCKYMSDSLISIGLLDDAFDVQCLRSRLDDVEIAGI